MITSIQLQIKQCGNINFLHIYFLSMVPVLSSISSLHANANLTIRRFLHE